MKAIYEISQLRNQLREIKLGTAAGYELFHYPFNQPDLRFQASKDGIMIEFCPDLDSLMTALEKRENKA